MPETLREIDQERPIGLGEIPFDNVDDVVEATGCLEYAVQADVDKSGRLDEGE